MPTSYWTVTPYALTHYGAGSRQGPLKDYDVLLA